MFSSAKRMSSFSFMGSLVFVTTNFDFYKPHPSTVLCFVEPPGRDYIRGQYENKIRMMSPPEKIFEVFATQKKDKNIYMSHLDLFKAVCPYNYTSKERDYDHSHDPAFESSALVQFADSDRDGRISLYEYYLFVAFLQTNLEDFVKFFGSLTDRLITKEELRAFLKFIQQKKQDNLTITKYMPDPRKQHLSREELDKVEEQIVSNLFENKPNIKLSKLLNLRDLIYNEIYAFEFKTFELTEDGKISGEDFAKSIICYLDPSLVNKYWKLLNKIEWDGTVTLEQYTSFQKFLRENLTKMEEKIKKKGVLSRKKLKELISDYSKGEKTQITDNQIDIFLQVLDVNGNNRIDHDEFVGVVKSRTFYGSSDKPRQRLEKPFIVLQDKFWKAIDKLNRIYNIIIE